MGREKIVRLRQGQRIIVEAARRRPRSEPPPLRDLARYVETHADLLLRARGGRYADNLDLAMDTGGVPEQLVKNLHRAKIGSERALRRVRRVLISSGQQPEVADTFSEFIVYEHLGMPQAGKR
ncbi:MAG: hypothetical protein M1484_00250 [Patescibacteria group bacterium]|nr:hypothetical protein [Patescibacteria group bacterium]